MRRALPGPRAHPGGPELTMDSTCHPRSYIDQERDAEYLPPGNFSRKAELFLSCLHFRLNQIFLLSPPPKTHIAYKQTSQYMKITWKSQVPKLQNPNKKEEGGQGLGGGGLQ